MKNEIKSTKVARELTKNPAVFFNEGIEGDSLNKRILCDDKSAKVAFISLFPELKNKISPA